MEPSHAHKVEGNRGTSANNKKQRITVKKSSYRDKKYGSAKKES